MVATKRYQLESPYRTIGIALNFEDIEMIKKHCAKLNLTISKFGRMLLLDSLDDYIKNIAE